MIAPEKHPGVRSTLHSVLRRRGHDPIARDPWYFPSAEAYSKVHIYFLRLCGSRADPGGGKQLLVSEGFEVVNISLVPRHTPLTGDVLGWLRLFTKNTTFFQGIGLDETEAILGEVSNACEVDNKDVDSDRWMMLYVRLRVLAKRL